MRFASCPFVVFAISTLPVVSSAAFSPEDLTGTWWSNATALDMATDAATGTNSSQAVLPTRIVCPPWEPASLASQVNVVEIQTDDDGTYASRVRACFWRSQEDAILSPDNSYRCKIFAGLWDVDAGVLEAYSIYNPEAPLYSTTLELSALVGGDIGSLAYKERGRVDLPGPDAKIGLLVKNVKIYKASSTPLFRLPGWDELSTPKDATSTSSGVSASSIVVVSVAIVLNIYLHLL
jgi:hypothetical protein